MGGVGSVATSLLLAVSLAACNQTTAANAPQVAAAAAPSVPQRPDLPPDASCTKAFDRYQNVLKADVTTGNVEQKVFDQIQTELAKAGAACAAGRDGEAMALIRSSQAKHGYHV
ncbi:hypothetical protein [Beijerinckia mobilis]|uniref:hypothetical protein n=1 Tax=Beijerinckia mobilis TaxID=231434 RepID=UPI00054FCAC4|nr:hypothetical protein [Beijerinckia mobilis]